MLMLRLVYIFVLKVTADMSRHKLGRVVKSVNCPSEGFSAKNHRSLGSNTLVVEGDFGLLRETGQTEVEGEKILFF
jgi:hypothetical protein